MRLDAIGDFIIWSACAHAYRILYPQDKYHLVLLGHVAWQEVAKKLNIFDEVLAIDRKKYMLNVKYRLNAWKTINQYNYDTIVYHTYSREFASGDLIVRRLKGNNKIAIHSDNAIDSYFWQNLSAKWYTHIIKPQFYRTHELIKNAAFIQSIGIKDYKVAMPIIKTENCPCEELDLPENYFIIFPGARVGLRKWNGQNFADLAEKIVALTNWQVVICGGSDDRILAQNILALSNVAMINLCGATSLLQLIGIINKAKVLIGNETSGIHIAAAVQTPSVCILGGGHFGRFVPYPDELYSNFKPFPVFEKMECFGCNWNCIYQIGKESTVPCIKNISVEKVWREIEDKIAEIA